MACLVGRLICKTCSHITLLVYHERKVCACVQQSSTLKKLIAHTHSHIGYAKKPSNLHLT